jgi:hypothetical protein
LLTAVAVVPRKHKDYRQADERDQRRDAFAVVGPLEGAVLGQGKEGLRTYGWQRQFDALFTSPRLNMAVLG